jgi:putative transposase
VMSNHHHLVITDPRGVLPDFLRELHRATAKAINASQGQWENLWAAEQCNAVRLVDAQTILEKIAYVATNPVAAGLVEQPEQWPGLTRRETSAEQVERPDDSFGEHGTSPVRVMLRVAPPTFSADTAEDRAEWPRRLQAAVKRSVAEAQRMIRAAGRRFLGAAGVLAQSFVKKARSYEVKRGLVPRVAAKDRSLRRALIRSEQAFRSLHRGALTDWRAGLRSVVFPFGTWWMRVHHAAVTALAPSVA